MAKPTTSYRCTACQATTVKWSGLCPKCGARNTMDLEAPVTANPGMRSGLVGVAPVRPARPVSSVNEAGPVPRITTGIGEFDRVLGGGLVAGQMCLLSGAPGSGKSTLVLAVADALAARLQQPVLYISGEESVEQIAIRARRIGATSDHLLLADDTDLGAAIGHIDAHAPQLALVIVDSVQTMASSDVEGRAGGVTQVMEVAQALTRIAKTRNLPIILIGQVTKDSNVAGPRALEHIVDATLSLEGDPHSSLRLLRSVKNRYGSLEVAAFEQTDTGMQEVLDPSMLFRGHRDTAVAGTCITVTIEGNRALAAEVQVLVAPTTNPNPRRGVSGLDSSRMAMLIAVSERTAALKLFDKDVFLATIGGMRLSDPGSDLAVCLAIVSASQEAAIALDLAAVGEVTLSGDVRPVPHMTERISEAARLGFRRLLVPVGTTARVRDRALELVEVPTLAQAITAVRLGR
ncbi:MAG: DNA repair protein RadA [Candidatus Nanopelagicales bacterium]|nr:DNA repair protein RadA [Candidatus Nanopelagicales bacterium]